jgi:hypothetical protein
MTRLSSKVHLIGGVNVGPAWEFYFPVCNHPAVMAVQPDDPQLTYNLNTVSCKNCKRLAR